MENFWRVDLRNFSFENDSFISIARRWRSPFVFVDTKFPDTIRRPAKTSHSLLSPEERYSLLVRNADDLRPMQIGITLCHPIHNQLAATWLFDLRDSDPLTDSLGINLEHTRRIGVPLAWLAQLLFDAGLVGNQSTSTWIAFEGGYDFIILLKALIHLQRPPWLVITQAKFPETPGEFRTLIRRVFGVYIYDVKCMMKGCGLCGGLESVAAQLEVERAKEKANQAGSHSLLTCQVFLKIKELYFSSGENWKKQLLPYDGFLSGFEK